nr:helix-turn-helix transcriptional regulator [Catenuloplanes japonicus]
MDGLGEFLRAQRARVTPAEAGLPAAIGRRVAGLRREEVAVPAGVSADYYTRLEQGRERNPSAQVMDALCTALRLGADARARVPAGAAVTERARRGGTHQRGTAPDHGGVPAHGRLRHQPGIPGAHREPGRDRADGPAPTAGRHPGRHLPRRDSPGILRQLGRRRPRRGQRAAALGRLHACPSRGVPADRPPLRRQRRLPPPVGRPDRLRARADPQDHPAPACGPDAAELSDVRRPQRPRPAAHGRDRGRRITECRGTPRPR